MMDFPSDNDHQTYSWEKVTKKHVDPITFSCTVDVAFVPRIEDCSYETTCFAMSHPRFGDRTTNGKTKPTSIKRKSVTTPIAANLGEFFRLKATVQGNPENDNQSMEKENLQNENSSKSTQINDNSSPLSVNGVRHTSEKKSGGVETSRICKSLKFLSDSDDEDIDGKCCSKCDCCDSRHDPVTERETLLHCGSWKEHMQWLAIDQLPGFFGSKTETSLQPKLW